MLQNIKKIELRSTYDQQLVVDLVNENGTKRKVLVTDIAKELELIDSQIHALQRRRALLEDMQVEITLMAGKEVFEPVTITEYEAKK